MPSSLDEAVQVAVTVSNAEGTQQADTKKVFSARRDASSQAIVCFNCSKRGHYARDCRFKGKEGSSDGNARARQMAGGRRAGTTDHRPRNSSVPGTPKGKFIRCYNCNKIGHHRDQCPLLTGNNSTTSTPNNSRSATRSLKPTQAQQASRSTLVYWWALPEMNYS
jgi:hypothetical protein